MKRSTQRTIIISAAVATAGLVTRQLIKETWKHTQGEEPPSNPEREGVEWRTALMWSLGVAFMSGLTRMVTRSYMTKKLPANNSVPPANNPPVNNTQPAAVPAQT